MPCHEVAGTRRAPVPGPPASPALRPPRAPGPPRAGASAKRKPRRSRPPLQPLSLSAAEALSLGLPAASPAPAPGPQGKASDTERSFGSFSLFQMRASTSSASTPLRLDGCTAGEHGSNWLLLACIHGLRQDPATSLGFVLFWHASGSSEPSPPGGHPQLQQARAEAPALKEAVHAKALLTRAQHCCSSFSPNCFFSGVGRRLLRSIGPSCHFILEAVRGC